MDTPSQNGIALRFDVVPHEAKEALDLFSKQAWIGESGWYLAGGTALALTVGHRKSVDLDFFTTKPAFKAISVLREFSGNSDWRTTYEEDDTIYGELRGTKLSFIAYPFFLPKQSFIRYGFVNILQPLDVAVMKIVAISQRGTKRDFFDLYWCSNNLEPLLDIIKRVPEQYPSTAHNYHHILKSLVYFDDAENDPDPDIRFEASWKHVKGFFTKEVPAIAEKVIGG